MSKGKATASAHGGSGFLGLLTLLFVGLKLTGHIDWPWLWVLAPVWSCTGVVVLLLGGLAAFAVFGGKR